MRKISHLGAPIEVNYRAMFYSLIVRVLERIPTIKDLIKRLQNDILFRPDCGFMLSEAYPVLRDALPLAPQWGVKKNSDGKNIFWYGYKGHLAVGSSVGIYIGRFNQWYSWDLVYQPLTESLGQYQDS